MDRINKIYGFIIYNTNLLKNFGLLVRLDQTVFRKMVKRFLLFVLSAETIYEIRRRRRHQRSGPSGDTFVPNYAERKDVTKFSVEDKIFVEVFWKTLPNATGPAFSFFAYDEEVLRFDCAGPGIGHFHASFLSKRRTQHNRNYFFEHTRETQIQRAVFELQNNIGYYLERHPWKRVREITLDEDHWASLCSDAGQLAGKFLLTVPELISAENLDNGRKG